MSGVVGPTPWQKAWMPPPVPRLSTRGAAPPEVSYADRAGKYMRQRGVALPRL